MKNSTAPNRKTGRMIAKNLIVLFTVALAGFCGIQAWFTDKSSAEADGINVECQAPDGIEIAVVGHGDPAPANDKYTVGKITLNKDNCRFLEKLQLTEITGDGTYFSKPALIQLGGKAIVDTSPTSVWSDPTVNEHYLSFDLYIRSKSQYNIAIGGNSTIKPVAPQLTTQDGMGITNKSKYGNFSRDSVVGAVRFSVVDYTNPPSKKLLWLPAPNIFLEQDGDKYTLSDNKRDGDSYKHVFYNKQKEKKTVSSTTGDDAFVVNKDGFPDGKFTYELGENKEIARLEKPSGTGQENNQFYSAMVTCNMWIEGEDEEARLALINGEFKVNLVLTKETKVS